MATGKKFKILIDTGANKNILRPGIIPENKVKPAVTTAKNIFNTQEVKQKCTLNILGNKLPPQTFYILNFHEFFDGILGSESMAKMKATINFDKDEIILNNIPFTYKKYFPTTKTINNVITCDTTKNGDWYVPKPQKLTKDLTIQPGLYRAENYKTQIIVSSDQSNFPKENIKLGLFVHNFETIEPEKNNKRKFSIKELECLIRMNHMSQLEKEKITEIIAKNQNILLKPDEKLTCVKDTEHEIFTTDNKPVYTKSYRYPHHFKKDVEEQVKDMLENGVISNSTSPYNSPIWVVPKKVDASGKRKVRLVIDFRKLNEKTISDKFPIPQIEDILDHLGKCQYFTTLDMKSGFHQIAMSLKDKIKTAFSTESGHYEFNRMPFGLKNAPATFQRMMNNILAGLIGKTCFVYLDDIIVFGTSLENHLKNLQLVLERLENSNLKIQLDKCEFLKRETEFLGHIVTPEGVKPNPDKIQKILDWPLPKTEKEIKSFLGMTGFYRRFVKDYSKLVKPMSKYTKKDIKIDTKDSEFKKSFDTLKKIIASDQILAYPDFSQPFILTTDASDYALGAVLSQKQNGTERPIAFGSRTLNDTETRYATNEKEALAIIWAVKKYKPYLYGQKFTLVTDHKPLTFIKSSDKNSKILRWRLELENFDYEVIYKEGRTNVVADALSRLQPDPPPAEVNTQSITSDSQTAHSAQTSDDYFIHFSDRPINNYRNQIIFKISHIDSEVLETPFPGFKRITVLKNSFSKDEITNFIKKFHDNKQTAILAPESLTQLIQESFRENFSEKGHFVFTPFMVEDVANEERQNLLISQEHERAHRGITEVENQLKRSYFFPKLHGKIKSYINTCTTCYKHKYDRRPYNIKISPRPITDKPFRRVHMDIFIINKESFLSIIDSFSKFLQMLPIKTKNLQDVKKALSKYISTFGAPDKIVTDHETTFRSIQLRDFLDAFGTQLEYASSSESNGQVEKTHSTIIEIYNTNKEKFRAENTKTIVRASVALYNDTIHSSTNFTPNEVIFNSNDLQIRNDINDQAKEIFTKVKESLLKAQTRQKKLNDKKEDPPEIQENQEVFLKPNIRTKTQPRGQSTNAQNVQEKTFNTKNGTKRNKNKIKRMKKK